MLRYEPPQFAVKEGNHGLTRHSQLVTKAINARNHGAKALVLVNGKLGDGEEDLLTRFGSVSGPEDIGIIFTQVKNDVADEWLKAAGKSLAEVQKQIDDSGKPASFELGGSQSASIAVSVKTTRATVDNVLAYLPGKTDEYVIVGAHYDHLGRGHFDSLAPSQIGQLHPGADDNGSGTAGVLELARIMAPLKGQLQRGILFESFAGEELGLLGSAAWVKNPTKPLDKAVAMLNMDMIGRIKNAKVYIGGVGTGSTLKATVEQAAANSGFKIEYSPGGILVERPYFVCGEEDSSAVFLLRAALRLSQALRYLGEDRSGICRRVCSLWWRQLPCSWPMRRTAQHFKLLRKRRVPGGSGERGYGPYFGSIPDFGQVETGVKFSDVKPGSPAAKAGFKAGDVLVEFGGKPIKNLYDFTDALRRSKVGEVVEVKVLRDGKPVTASVKLEQRK